MNTCSGVSLHIVYKYMYEGARSPSQSPGVGSRALQTAANTPCRRPSCTWRHVCHLRPAAPRSRPASDTIRRQWGGVCGKRRRARWRILFSQHRCWRHKSAERGESARVGSQGAAPSGLLILSESFCLQHRGCTPPPAVPGRGTTSPSWPLTHLPYADGWSR